MNALFDDELGNIRLKEADEGLESPVRSRTAEWASFGMNGESRWSRGSSRGNTRRRSRPRL
jgi:hypothetical protein